MTRSERLAWFIGQTARPLAIMSSSFAASIASVIVALRVENGNDGAILMAAIFAGVGALYGFKAVEVWRGKEAEAKAGQTPPDLTVTVEADHVDVNQK